MIRIALFIILSQFIVAYAFAGASIKIAVIDTGLNAHYSGSHLCSKGHFDFVANIPAIGHDEIGHGTEVVQTIELEAGASHDYCFLIYKAGVAKISGQRIVKAFYKAKAAGAKVFNLSYAGPGSWPEEQDFILTNPALLFVAAAGNFNTLLTKGSCNTYPACYNFKNVLTVGSWDEETNAPMWFSNYGPEVEYMVRTCRPTSFAAAIVTGRTVKEALRLKGSK